MHPVEPDDVMSISATDGIESCKFICTFANSSKDFDGFVLQELCTYEKVSLSEVQTTPEGMDLLNSLVLSIAAEEILVKNIYRTRMQ